MKDFPIGIGKTILRPNQIRNLEWINDKDAFLEKQEKYLTQLDSKIGAYKLFIEKDPSRSKVDERIELLENIQEVYGKIMLEPSMSVMYEMPFFDLELEKLKNEKVVIEFLNEIRNPNGIFGNDIRDMAKGTVLEFAFEFEKNANELHQDFVRGFVLTFMKEGKQAHTYYEVFKDDPNKARSIMADSMKMLIETDWQETWPKIKEILDVINGDFWKNMVESEGGYAAFVGGKIFGFIAISVMTGSLSGLNKLGFFLKYIGLMGIGAKRMEMKYIATLSDGYDLLTNPQIHEDLLRLFHQKLPELSLVNLREGLEAMIRYVISLPPVEQSEAVAVLLEFIASGDLKKLQKNKYFKKWISMWLQRDEGNEQISVGTKLWDDRYDKETISEGADTHKADKIAEEMYWTRYGLMDLREADPVDPMIEFKEKFMDILDTDKGTIREFTYENRELVRKLILDETPFGWRVNFRNLMEGIVTKLQAHVGLGDLFSEEELKLGFTVTYPLGYHGKKALIATSRNGRKYLNKDKKYLAIFDDCDIIIR